MAAGPNGITKKANSMASKLDNVILGLVSEYALFPR